ncbi:MAG: hypothetical protein WCQ77_09920 [Planctomycetota bacterium]
MIINFSIFRRFVLAAVAAAVLPQAGGCDWSSRGTVPVSGRVTFGGAAPEKPCVVCFVPEPGVNGGATSQRAGFAETRPDGSYTATSFKPGDGLLPGTYTVRLECWKVRGNHDKEGVSFVPKGFTPPAVVVTEGAGSVAYSVDVK